MAEETKSVHDDIHWHKEKRERRSKQRFWIFVLNAFYMFVIGYILFMGLDTSPAETGIFMAFAAMITTNSAYLFGEVWEDMNITKTGIKVS